MSSRIAQHVVWPYQVEPEVVLVPDTPQPSTRAAPLGRRGPERTTGGSSPGSTARVEQRSRRHQTVADALSGFRHWETSLELTIINRPKPSATLHVVVCTTLDEPRTVPCSSLKSPAHAAIRWTCRIEDVGLRQVCRCKSDNSGVMTRVTQNSPRRPGRCDPLPCGWLVSPAWSSSSTRSSG